MSAAGGMAATTQDGACPVCRWPGKVAAPCEYCDWRQEASPIEGVLATAQDLAGSQRDYDLRAAARVAGVTGVHDEELLARLARLARGEPCQESHLAAAMAWVSQADERPAGGGAGIIHALTRLVVEKCDALGFIEIGPDELAVRTLIAGPLGRPVPGVADSLRWDGILPLLPADPELRYLRMAGGVGSSAGLAGVTDTGPAALSAALDAAITPALARLRAASAAAADIARAARVAGTQGSARGYPGAAPRRLDFVLVLRTHGWPLLEKARARAHAVLRPVAQVVALDSRPLERIVDDIAARAPLRYAHDLVLVEVDPQSGTVRPARFELFPAGTQVLPGAAHVARAVDLAAPKDHSAQVLALPVIARRDPLPAARDLDWVRRHLDQVTERWSPVAVAEIAAPERAFELSALLLGPGRVELHAPHGRLLANGAGDWPQLLADLPSRVLTAAADIDLAVLVELGGTGEAVASRITFVRELAREFNDEPGARIAVLGYRDHFGRHRVDAIGRPDAEADALVVGCGLSTPAGVLDVLDRAALWRAVPVNDAHAAPGEDALRIIADRAFGWRAGVRHVLLTVGRRPPHPPRVSIKGEVMLPCPHRASWERSLARLREQQAVECLAVLDRRAATEPAPGPASEYARRAWRQLGSQGTAVAGEEAASPRRLRQAAGHPERLPRIRLATLAGVAASPPSRKEAHP